MSGRYIISDLHIGHKNISKFRGGGMSSEEHWEMAIEGLMRIPKKGTLFLLGDIVLDKDYLPRVANIPCKNVILLMGNHDCYEGRGIDIKDLADTYTKVMSLHKYKGHWMSHAPKHPAELRGAKNVHGHTHPYLMLDEEGGQDTRYISCCVEYTSYDPITWEYAISDEYQQECWKLWKEKYEPKFSNKE